MTQSDIANAKQEMITHQGLSYLQEYLQNSLDELDKDEDHLGVLTYKLALSEAERIQQLLYDGVIGYEEVSEMLTNPDKFEEIFDNL